MHEPTPTPPLPPPAIPPKPPKLRLDPPRSLPDNTYTPILSSQPNSESSLETPSSASRFAMHMEKDRISIPHSFRATQCLTLTSVIQALGSSIRYQSTTPQALLDDNTPAVLLEESLLEDNRRSLQNTLIGQFLDRMDPSRVLTQRLPALWSHQGCLKVLKLPNGFFLFKFTSVEDPCKAREGSPWKVAGSSLAVTAYIPNFSPHRAFLGTTPLWIRLPGLPLDF